MFQYGHFDQQKFLTHHGMPLRLKQSSFFRDEQKLNSPKPTSNLIRVLNFLLHYALLSEVNNCYRYTSTSVCVHSDYIRFLRPILEEKIDKLKIYTDLVTPFETFVVHMLLLKNPQF